MRDFKKLKVWEKAHRLTLAIYKLTNIFPKEERFGLISQMRRSSISITSNIAEGCGRNSEGQFLHFLNIAFGSANELEYQILLSHDLGYLDQKKYKILDYMVVEVKKMLWSLMDSLGDQPKAKNQERIPVT